MQDVFASRELLGVAHFFCGTPTMKKKVHGTGHARNTHPTTQNGYRLARGGATGWARDYYTKWLRGIMRLEDQRLKQASCNSERFQVSHTELYSEGKCSCNSERFQVMSLVGYMSGEVAGRDGDHHDDEKG